MGNKNPITLVVMMKANRIPPDIEQSTREERLAFVQNEWKCLGNCELCGKCHILKDSFIWV